MIAQGATPYLMLSIKDYDLSGAENLMVTIHNQTQKMDFGPSRVIVTSQTTPTTESLLTIHLTQQETLSLPQGLAKVQARWKTNREAYTTTIESVDVGRCLYKGVI